MPKYIVSFDIGKKNFAFVIEELANIEQFEQLPKITKTERYNKSKDKFIDGTLTEKFKSVVDKLYNLNKVVLVSNNNLTDGAVEKTILEEKIYLNMYEILDQYVAYWDNCEVILIEKQMAFGTGKQNTMAMKLAQHCYSYFIYRYRGKIKLIEFPAYLKTQLLGAPKNFGTLTKEFKNGKTKEIKDNRKRWSARLAISILANRSDKKSLEMIEEKHDRKQQQDDLADCLLMNQAYCLSHYYDKILHK